MHFLLILFIYFVRFTDKQGCPAEPALSERALAQREQWNIPIDSLDYAVSPIYLDSLRHLGATILHTSRWINGATIKITEDATLKQSISECSFVQSMVVSRDGMDQGFVRSISARQAPASKLQTIDTTFAQLNVYNLPTLHRQGFQGQGIHIAVMDAGFQYLHSLGRLASLREHILGCYDFSDEPDSMFAASGNHGIKCLGLIGMKSGGYTGAATEAQFYVMRTEENQSESPKELDNLIAAWELADSLGVNICSVSLGYNNFDNPNFNIPYELLDGKSLRASRAATIAARKGMLLCIAMGNSGRNGGHTLLAPSDADSILSVGAVGSDGIIAPFSSRGPSADGRVKPDVCAMGYQACVLSPFDNGLEWGNGTSFACPLMAGFAACLWSAFPKENAMQIRERIISSANHYNNPDSVYGYGIPDANKAFLFTPTNILIDTSNDMPKVEKLFIRGQLYIRRDDMLFDITGKPVQRP